MVEPYYTDTKPDIAIYNGNCRQVIKELESESVDSVVTDPPYELGFMGKGWDRSGIAYDASVWSECLRVLKPGGHLLAFGGSRTYHRLACAIEDAGFEIRDQIQWIYGSGFPKSLDVSKAIDSYLGVERASLGVVKGAASSKTESLGVFNQTYDATTATTWAAKQWDGYGTALKPAHEPIVLGRKPLIRTVAENVLQHGTGGLNIDRCRVETTETLSAGSRRLGDGIKFNLCEPSTEYEQNANGRWPTNVIHDGSDEVVRLFPETESGQVQGGGAPKIGLYDLGLKKVGASLRDANRGSAARFFYCAKADKREREAGLRDLPLRSAGEVTDRQDGSDGLNSPRAGSGRTSGARNIHPTVKPLDLMRYLCRLVTPPNGLVLDPFGGSGSTGRAALLEGFRAVLIELNADYCEIAARRCAEPMQESLFQLPRVAEVAVKQDGLFNQLIEGE